MIDRIGIRARIAGGSVLIAALLALVAGLVINAEIERIVRDGTTDVLESDASSYVAAIRNEPDSGYDRPARNQRIAVVDPDGTVKLSTLPKALAVQLPTLIRADRTTAVTAGGVDYIVLTVPVRSDTGTYHVTAAGTTASETTVLSQMRLLLIVGLSIIVLAIAVTAWVLTSVSLAPVRRLRSTAERLSTAPSRELLPVGRARDDISALATTLNGLIERLRDSADRERQLVSDASHELRTPLAILRAQLEVATDRPRDLDGLLADLRPVERSADRLSRLVVSLLELSRIESDEREATRTSVRALLEEIDESVERAGYRLGVDTRVELSRGDHLGGVPGDARFSASTEDMGRILDNLIGNALAAVGDRGEIRVDTELVDDDDRLRLVLRVSDTGGGMSDEFLPHALERFRREDESRGDRGGAGLGLSIVAALAHRAGGDIRLENRHGDGLTVVIDLPAADRAPTD